MTFRQSGVAALHYLERGGQCLFPQWTFTKNKHLKGREVIFTARWRSLETDGGSGADYCLWGLIDFDL